MARSVNEKAELPGASPLRHSQLPIGGRSLDLEMRAMKRRSVLENFCRWQGLSAVLVGQGLTTEQAIHGGNCGALRHYAIVPL